MTELAKLKARYSDAEKLLKTAEEDIRPSSKERLAELLKLSQREQLEYLDDTSLTLVDRGALRRSIAANLQRGTVEFAVAGAKFGGRRGSRWSRRHWPSIILSGIILVPSGVFFMMAWENTGEARVAIDPIALSWRFPSGQVVQMVSKPNDEFLIMSRSEHLIVVRQWYPGQGYVIANIRQ